MRRLITVLLLGGLALGVSACAMMSQKDALVTSDAVCGAVVNRGKAIRKVYGGRDYYFDSEECAAEFAAHPSTYASVHLSRVGPR